MHEKRAQRHRDGRGDVAEDQRPVARGVQHGEHDDGERERLLPDGQVKELPVLQLALEDGHPRTGQPVDQQDQGGDAHRQDELRLVVELGDPGGTEHEQQPEQTLEEQVDGPGRREILILEGALLDQVRLAARRGQQIEELDDDGDDGDPRRNRPASAAARGSAC